MEYEQNEKVTKLIIELCNQYIDSESFVKAVATVEGERKIYFGYPRLVDDQYLILNVRRGFTKLPIKQIRTIRKVKNKHEDDWW